MLVRSEQKRYAVHDVDGTLWRGSLFTTVMWAAANAEIVERPGHWADEDPTGLYLRNLHERIKGRPTNMFDGLYEGLAAVVARRMFRFTAPLLAAERAAGMSVVLVSHSPRQFVDVFAQVVGNVDHVIGTELAESGGRFTGEPIVPYDKAAAIGRLAAAPAIAVGDMTHDLPMLTMAEFPLAIGIATGNSHSLHPYIHRNALDIPVIDEDLDGGLEQCVRPLTTSGYGCALDAISTDDILSRLSLSPA